MVDLFPHNGRSSAGPAKKATKARSAKALTTDELPDGTYYDFTTPTGEVLYIQRHRGAQYRKVGEDRWEPGIEGVQKVLYRLPELVEGVRAGKTVYHVEGPKDVETARKALG